MTQVKTVRAAGNGMISCQLNETEKGCVVNFAVKTKAKTWKDIITTEYSKEDRAKASAQYDNLTEGVF